MIPFYRLAVIALVIFSSLSSYSQQSLIGTLQLGGQGNGLIFAIPTGSTTLGNEYAFKGGNGSQPFGTLVLAPNGKLYGTTYKGGVNDLGVLFEYDPAANTLVNKIDFAGATNGAGPGLGSALLLASNGKFYGTTMQGGVNNQGVLFEYDYSNNTLTKKIDFAAATNGSTPQGGLSQASNGKIYGTALLGGANNLGVLFVYDPSNSSLTKLFDFGGAGGSNPRSEPIPASNGKLYGAVPGGSFSGLIYEYDPSTSTMTKKADFKGATNGSLPYGRMTLASNGKMYGLTNGGGANGKGVLYEFDPSTSTLTKYIDFDGTTNGGSPTGALMQSANGKLYGVTENGNGTPSSSGSLFEYDPVAHTLTPLFNFNGTNGAYPWGSLVEVCIKPAPTSGITGNSTVYVGSAPVTYTAATIANASSYSWTVPAGAVITSGQNTSSITVDFSGVSFGNYNVSVAGVNACGTGATINLPVSYSKKPQTITFNALATRLTTDAPFSLSASSDSGLPVSYTSSNTQVATVSGNTLTIVGAGTANITAKQAGDATYASAADVIRTLTVNKVPQTITFASLPSKLVTDAPFSLSATSDSGLPVSYTSSNTQVATISGSTVTIVGAGTANITAKQAGNATYASAADVIQTLTVNKIAQTITFASLPSKLVTDAPFSLSATSDSGLPVSYTSSNVQIATISGNTLTIVASGSVDITAHQPGNATYSSAADVIQTLIISKLSQTITFGPLPGKLLTDAPFTLSATADSGLPVSYTSSNFQVATVNGNTVTITGAGTTSIIAQQPGDATYSSATAVVQTLTVTDVSKIISLSGTAVAKDTLSFGNIILGLSAQQTFTITNTGAATLTISNIDYGAGVTGNATSATLTSGNSTTVTVTFTPTTLGVVTAPITFTSDATAGSSQVIAKATAVKVTAVEEVPGQLSVFPNPGTGLFHLRGLESSSVKNLSVEVLDASGQSVGSFPLTPDGRGQYQLDVRALTNGLYLLKAPAHPALRVVKIN
jgi:uncharacterized repeat protein (TIGR03803 family)